MNSLLKFDAASNQWQNITATGNIPAPRGGHSAVLSRLIFYFYFLFDENY